MLGPMNTSLVKLSGQKIAPPVLIRSLAYVLFISLFVFEFLNYLGVLAFRVDYTWLGRVVSTGAVFSLVYVIDRVFQKTIHARLPALVWVLMAVLILFDFSGDFFGFYKRWMWYDRVAHFFSGPLLVASLLIVFQRLSFVRGWKYPPSLNYLLALGTNAFLAIAYESEEYLEDFFTGSQRLGNGPDTANDLLMNTVGAFLTIAFVVVYPVVMRAWKKRHRTPSLTWQHLPFGSS